MKNWRTTLIGVSAILAVIAKLDVPADAVKHLPEILAAVGLFFAGDASNVIKRR